MKKVLSILTASALAVQAAPLAAEALKKDFHLFVFGDSYTATCFNISGTQPSPKDPLGNPDPGNCTSSEGLVWPEYLTLKFNTTKVLTYDFAVSGASITDSFEQQILFTYEPKYAAQHGTNWTSANSIFASFIGINDINWQSLLFSGDGTSNFTKTFPPRMKLYFDLMDSLYNTGARRFFFVNMPPLDRAPMITMTNQTIVDNFAEGVKYFNEELLPDYVQDFTETHKNVKTIIYDAHTLFSTVLDNPHAYGYKNAHCFGKEGCFWANDYHPIWSFHERMASDMVTNLTTIGWPPYQPPEEE